MSDKHPPQQTGSSSEAGVLRGTSKATTPPLRGTPPYQEGSRKNSPPEKGEYPEGGRGLVPKLRFPEFREAGEWHQKPLSDLIKALDAGVSVNSGDRPANTGESGILKTSSVTNGVFDSSENKVVFDSAELKRLKEPVLKNTIIISRMNTPALVGANAYVEKSHKNLFLPDRLWAAKPKPETSMRFIACILGSEKGRAALSELATGTSGSMKNITKADVLELQILVPNLAEQQKIADCLSSLDTLIAAQAEKIDALKTHKKGLMQQLFPQDGETVPRLRFAEFRKAVEWESDVVGSLVELLSGYAFKSEFFSEEGEKLLTPKNFTRDGFASFTKENTKYTTEQCERRYVCREGDLLILLTDLTPTCELLGRPLLLSQYDGNVLLNQRIVKVMPKGKLEKRFLLYCFLTDGFRKRITNTATGSTVRHSSNAIIASTNILLPSLSEQQKIADCLSSLDTLITAETEKLDALKTHKKGLMQQLFPAVENEAGS